MQLTFIYLKLVSTLIFWKSDSILFENDYHKILIQYFMVIYTGI